MPPKPLAPRTLASSAVTNVTPSASVRPTAKRAREVDPIVTDATVDAVESEAATDATDGELPDDQTEVQVKVATTSVPLVQPANKRLKTGNETATVATAAAVAATTRKSATTLITTKTTAINAVKPAAVVSSTKPAVAPLNTKPLALAITTKVGVAKKPPVAIAAVTTKKPPVAPTVRLEPEEEVDAGADADAEPEAGASGSEEADGEALETPAVIRPVQNKTTVASRVQKVVPTTAVTKTVAGSVKKPADAAVTTKTIAAPKALPKALPKGVAASATKAAATTKPVIKAISKAVAAAAPVPPPPPPPPANLNSVEAVFSRAGRFRQVVASFADLVTDANFVFSKQGVSLQAMDGSHVSLVAMILEAAGFQFYRSDRDRVLGLNVVDLMKILKFGKATDSLTLMFQDGGDSLFFAREGEEQQDYGSYQLKLIDVDEERLGIPETEYDCVIEISSSTFQRLIRELKSIGDTCLIKVCKKDGRVQFEVQGAVGKVIEYLRETTDPEQASSDTAVKLDVKRDVSQTFAIKYLESFAKATPLSTRLRLKMSPDVPLVCEYPIRDDDNHLGYVRFYLAPKIEEDEPKPTAAQMAPSVVSEPEKVEREVKTAAHNTASTTSTTSTPSTAVARPVTTAVTQPVVTQTAVTKSTAARAVATSVAKPSSVSKSTLAPVLPDATTDSTLPIEPEEGDAAGSVDTETDPVMGKVDEVQAEAPFEPVKLVKPIARGGVPSSSATSVGTDISNRLDQFAYQPAAYSHLKGRTPAAVSAAAAALEGEDE